MPVATYIVADIIRVCSRLCAAYLCAAFPSSVCFPEERSGQDFPDFPVRLPRNPPQRYYKNAKPPKKRLRKLIDSMTFRFLLLSEVVPAVPRERQHLFVRQVKTAGLVLATCQGELRWGTPTVRRMFTPAVQQQFQALHSAVIMYGAFQSSCQLFKSYFVLFHNC